MGILDPFALIFEDSEISCLKETVSGFRNFPSPNSSCDTEKAKSSSLHCSAVLGMFERFGRVSRGGELWCLIAPSVFPLS